MKIALPHWIIAAVALIGTVAPQVATAFPQTAAVDGIIEQIVPLVLGILGALSGSVLVQDSVTGVRGLARPSVAPPAPPAP